MLPRPARLLRREFPKGPGMRVSFSYGTLRIYPGPSFKGAVVTPKKVFKTAVLRHRAKRRIADALSLSLEKKTPRLHVVVFPSPEALRAPVVDIEKALTKALAHA